METVTSIIASSAGWYASTQYNAAYILSRLLEKSSMECKSLTSFHQRKQYFCTQTSQFLESSSIILINLPFCLASFPGLSAVAYQRHSRWPTLSIVLILIYFLDSLRSPMELSFVSFFAVWTFLNFSVIHWNFEIGTGTCLDSFMQWFPIFWALKNLQFEVLTGFYNLRDSDRFPSGYKWWRLQKLTFI